MNRARGLTACLLIVACFGAACKPAATTDKPAPTADFATGTLVDLSYPFDAETVYWPTADSFKLQQVAAGETPQGYYYAANNYAAAEHGGTHIDAPIHFAAGRNTVDQIPLAQLIGPGVLVDVAERCAGNPDYQIAVADLEAWERAHGQLPQGALLLLRTGYGKFYPDRRRYMGTDERGAAAVAKLHFPGLHPDAARWLTNARSVKAVGLDTPSIDYGQSTLFESHRLLFERNVPAFENLANLDRLPAKGFTVIALPMKIKGGSGGPLRIVAVLNDGR